MNKKSEVTVTQSRTKSGKTVNVAIIPLSMIPDTDRIELHTPVEIATQHGCAHWRVVATDGRLVAAGRSAPTNAAYGSFGPE